MMRHATDHRLRVVRPGNQIGPPDCQCSTPASQQNRNVSDSAPTPLPAVAMAVMMPDSGVLEKLHQGAHGMRAWLPSFLSQGGKVGSAVLQSRACEARGEVRHAACEARGEPGAKSGLRLLTSARGKVRATTANECFKNGKPVLRLLTSVFETAWRKFKLH